MSWVTSNCSFSRPMNVVNCAGSFEIGLSDDALCARGKSDAPRAKEIHSGRSASGMPRFSRRIFASSFDGLSVPASMRRKVTAAQPTWSANACRLKSNARRCLRSHSPKEISSCMFFGLYQFLYQLSHYVNHPISINYNAYRMFDFPIIYYSYQRHRKWQGC